LYSAVFGLCKLLNLKPPQRNVVTEYGYLKYRDIDEDNSGEIEFEEFSSWIKNDIDL